MRAMRSALVLATALALVSGAAGAQAPTPSPTPVAKPASQDHTVSGVEVEAPPLPTKECGARDKACIDVVIAELRTRYPAQLKRFCFQREMRALQNTAEFGGDSPRDVGAYYTTGAILKIACATEKPAPARKPAEMSP
jgi:hypothetical protein